MAVVLASLHSSELITLYNRYVEQNYGQESISSVTSDQAELLITSHTLVYLILRNFVPAESILEYSAMQIRNKLLLRLWLRVLRHMLLSPS